MPSFSFDRNAKQITVLSPDVSIELIELYDACREYEEEMTSLDLLQIVEGEGLFDVGDLKKSLSVFLINGWKVGFQARPGPDTVECTIQGGDLVAYVGDRTTAQQSPIFPTAFVQVTLIQATTGGVVNLPVMEGQLQWLIDYFRDGTKVTDDEASKEMLWQDTAMTQLLSEWELFEDDELTIPWGGVNPIKGRKPST